jgi:hypothetical protein
MTYNIATNPIPKNKLWVTKPLAEIQEYIECLPKKDRADAYHIMMMTLNACHELVETEILNKEIFGS